MKFTYVKFFIIVFSCLLIYPELLNAAQPEALNGGPWKGNAILGNGKLCVVYSDDARITKLTGGRGIQHLYYKNYTADYAESASFAVFDKNNNPLTGKASTGLKNFFTTQTQTVLENGFKQSVECYVLPEDAAVMSISVEGKFSGCSQEYELRLRKTILTDRIINLISLSKDKNKAFAVWSNKTVLLAACSDPGCTVNLKDSVIVFSGKIVPDKKVNILLVLASSKNDAEKKLHSIEKLNDPYASASKYWNAWMNKGTIPSFKNDFKEKRLYTRFFKRTLYSVKSACLNGQIPADITGQFLTNNMPQLYPRDAMMCARVFLLTGHLKEAKQVISFWTKDSIPHKSKGEFYARYDAHAKAVDAGSGARYNEPEWDANGYLIQLLNMYHAKTKVWLADKNFIYELADFLVSRLDSTGLLYEGGIVEWTGYLPSTNMTCAAALKTASQIAGGFGDKMRAAEYFIAYKKISSSLYKMYDKKTKALTDVRFHGGKASDNSSISGRTADTLYMWDTSLNYGIIWGYPDNELVKSTNRFILNNTVILHGGVQYFYTEDQGLSSYGSAAFFFTTAASAEYQCRYGNSEIAKKQIDWMIKNSNTYGLMPERIYPDGSDCSDASPLSWCNAEFAASVLEFSKTLLK